MHEILVAGTALLAVIAYAVLAGADFGGGVWDLFATGPRRDQQREAIAHAMGPVWEANHVWLIFLLVILFTAFPLTFSTLSIGLFLPFHLVLLGIIARGASFVFRAYSPRTQAGEGSVMARYWGPIFGVASLITPLLLGLSLGTVSTGTIRVVNGVVVTHGVFPWITPLTVTMALLALALCAYLAAVYLTTETTGALREDFRDRALLAGTAVVGLALVLLPLVYVNAPHLWHGLLSLRAAPVILTGVVSALFSGYALLRRWYRAARVSAIVQIVALLSGWGIAQFPYLIYPDLTIFNTAANRGTLTFFLIALPIGMALLIPSLWLLFAVFKGETFARTSS